MIKSSALVTGACGFVGPYLADELSRHGFSVKGVDVVAGNLLGMPVFSCDIRDREGLRNILRSEEPDYIFHLASMSIIPRSWEDPRLACEINLMGLINLMECIRELGLESRVLLVGSACEYGETLREGNPVNEDAPLRPQSPFATSKVAQDYIASQYYSEHALNVVRVRPFTHSGPGQTDNFIVPRLCREVALVALGRKSTVESPNRSIRYDLTHVSDMARAYMLGAMKGMPGQVYNVASGSVLTIGKMLDVLSELSGLKLTVEEKVLDCLSDPEHDMLADNSRFVNETGWRPAVKPEAMLAETLQWWTSHLAESHSRGTGRFIAGH